MRTVIATCLIVASQVSYADVFDIVKEGDASRIEAIVTGDGFDATSMFQADSGDEYNLLEFAALETSNTDEVLSALLKNEDIKGDDNINILRAYHRLCDENTAVGLSEEQSEKEMMKTRVKALNTLLPALGTDQVDTPLPTDTKQRSLLLRCVANSYFQMVRTLIVDYKANPNYQDSEGSAALHYILRFPDELEERLRVAQDGSKKGSGQWRNDGHRLMTTRREMMDSVMRYATLFLDNGANGNLSNKQGSKWNGGHLERMHTVRKQQDERHSRNTDDIKQKKKKKKRGKDKYDDNDDDDSVSDDISDRRKRRDKRRAERKKRRRDRRRMREYDDDDELMDEDSIIVDDDDEDDDDDFDLSSMTEEERREALGSRRRETAEKIRRRRRRGRDKKKRRNRGKSGEPQSFTINSQEDLKRFQDEMGDGFVSGSFGGGGDRDRDDDEDDDYDDSDGYDDDFDLDSYRRNRRGDRDREREDRRREMDDRMESVRQRHEEMRARHEAEREERRRKRREKYGDDWDPSKLREQLQQEREERRRELDARMKQREIEREERRKAREERRRKRRKKHDL